MQQHASRFRAQDVNILVVTFEAGLLARAYLHETRLPFPVLVDEPRALYTAYGMLRGSPLAIWGPRTWWAYAKELWHGQRPLTDRAPSDIHQLGGDVLVDPAGTLRLVHVGSGPGDRPSVDDLLHARHG